jgi:membrane-associated phospholipid phosphatase
MRDLQKFVAGSVLAALLVFLSYESLDRPIALLAHDYVRKFEIFGQIIFMVPELVVPLAGLALLVVAACAIANRRLSYLQSVTVLCALSFFVAERIQAYLKIAFGRTWPETWKFDNPSFIRDGVYGFNPFHGGIWFASFPSGHMTAACAIASVLWICYPKWRPLYFAVVMAVSVGLVGANYHFLSDVLAGGYLGASVGWIATKMWKVGAYSSRGTVCSDRRESGE